MRPFNIYAAKHGARVVNRQGQSVRILCYDLRNNYKPIVAATDEGPGEQVACFTPQGQLMKDFRCQADLRMATDKQGNYIYSTPSV